MHERHLQHISNRLTIEASFSWGRLSLHGLAWQSVALLATIGTKEQPGYTATTYDTLKHYLQANSNRQTIHNFMHIILDGHFGLHTFASYGATVHHAVIALWFSCCSAALHAVANSRTCPLPKMSLCLETCNHAFCSKFSFPLDMLCIPYPAECSLPIQYAIAIHFNPS